MTRLHSHFKPTTLRDQLTWLAGKWTRIEDVFPIKHGDIPLHCYVSLPEGIYHPQGCAESAHLSVGFAVMWQVQRAQLSDSLRNVVRPQGFWQQTLFLQYVLGLPPTQ